MASILIPALSQRRGWLKQEQKAQNEAQKFSHQQRMRFNENASNL